ncbi:MAG: hypothetical protein MHM6MM_002682 [Cercozoa sp. M6MM]
MPSLPFPVDTWVWAPHPKHCFLPARVAGSTEDGRVLLQTEKHGELRIKPEKLAECDIAAHTSFTERVPNLVELAEFSHGAVLWQVRQQFENKAVFVGVGSILVSLNPHEPRSGVYDEAQASFYRASDSPLSNKPHAYGVTAAALQAIQRDQLSQSLVVTGESGSGKTFLVRRVLTYVAECLPSAQAGGNDLDLDQLVLKSSPILEAFGNACTVRNKNSSRFGKWLSLTLDSSKGMAVVGCEQTHYLLEQSRVVRVGAGERNFHAFYSMLCMARRDSDVAADAKLFVNNHVVTPDDFAMLRGDNNGALREVEARDEDAELDELLDGLSAFGFSAERQLEVWRLLSALLWLGNVEFEEAPGDSSRVTDATREDLETALALLHLDESDGEAVAKALSSRAITVQGETTLVALNPDAAKANRDSLVKTLYALLFDHLVDCINTCTKGESIPKEDAVTLGVLDIFGFEIFDTNRFAQFCINFANETLQRHFNEHVFEQELEEHREEGIPTEDIAFRDNKPCVELFSGQGGVVDVLNEELLLPNGSEQGFTDKCNKKFENHAFYEVLRSKRRTHFLIKHYAGEVQYDVGDFLDRNRNQLAGALAEAVAESKLPLASALVKMHMQRYSEAESRRKTHSTATIFVGQLGDLDEAIKATHPFYVRCINPNAARDPGLFDAVYVLEQLEYGGVFEALRVRRAGYEHRRLFQRFVDRYIYALEDDTERVKVRDLMTKANAKSKKESDARAEWKAAVDRLLNALKHDLSKAHANEDVQVGKTRVFFRQKALDLFEKLYTVVHERIFGTVQRMWLRWRFQRFFMSCAPVHKLLTRGLKTRQAQTLVNVVALVEGKEVAQGATTKLIQLKIIDSDEISSKTVLEAMPFVSQRQRETIRAALGRWSQQARDALREIEREIECEEQLKKATQEKDSALLESSLLQAATLAQTSTRKTFFDVLQAAATAARKEGVEVPKNVATALAESGAKLAEVELEIVSEELAIEMPRAESPRAKAVPEDQPVFQVKFKPRELTHRMQRKWKHLGVTEILERQFHSNAKIDEMRNHVAFAAAMDDCEWNRIQQWHRLLMSSLHSVTQLPQRVARLLRRLDTAASEQKLHLLAAEKQLETSPEAAQQRLRINAVATDARITAEQTVWLRDPDETTAQRFSETRDTRNACGALLSAHRAMRLTPRALLVLGEKTMSAAAGIKRRCEQQQIALLQEHELHQLSARTQSLHDRQRNEWRQLHVLMKSRYRNDEAGEVSQARHDPFLQLRRLRCAATALHRTRKDMCEVLHASLGTPVEVCLSSLSMQTGAALSSLCSASRRALQKQQRELAAFAHVLRPLLRPLTLEHECRRLDPVRLMEIAAAASSESSKKSSEADEAHSPVEEVARHVRVNPDEVRADTPRGRPRPTDHERPENRLKSNTANLKKAAHAEVSEAADLE